MGKCIWHWQWAVTGLEDWGNWGNVCVHLHLSQLLITLDWIITSISINRHKSRVLELGSSSALWTVSELRAHNTIFQISIKSKCWESSSLPGPGLTGVPSGRKVSQLQLSGPLGLMIFSISYLTFDFSKYKHFVLWLSIDFPIFPLQGLKGTQVQCHLAWCLAKFLHSRPGPPFQSRVSWNLGVLIKN